MAYSDIKEMLKDARNFAGGANDQQTVSLLKDIQLEVYDLIEENRELRNQIQELKNEKDISSKLEFANDAYYYNNKGPYCTKCWDVDSILVRMVVPPRPLMRVGNYRCNNCEAIVQHYPPKD